MIEIPTLRSNELIVQETYPGDERPWYVHEICLLDMGRFKTKEEAIAHRDFLIEKYSKED